MEPFDTELFISAIENRPVIWNSHLPNYSNKIEKSKAWEEICHIFCAGFGDKTRKEKALEAVELQKKGKSIKDCYNREKAKVRKISTGSGAKARKPYVYYKILTFLDPINEIRPPIPTPDRDDSADEHILTSNNPPKKVKRREDPQEKLFEVLTDNLEKINAAKESKDENPDKLFLLSLFPHFTAIKDEYKLDAQADTINLIRKYKNMGHYSRWNIPESDYNIMSTSTPFNTYGYQTYQPTTTTATTSNISAGSTSSQSQDLHYDSPSNNSEIIMDIYDEISPKDDLVITNTV